MQKMTFEEALKAMQGNHHLRYNPTGTPIRVVVLKNESVVPQVADGETDVATLERLVKEGLVAKRSVDASSTPGFEWYDLTEKGRNYKL